MKLKLLLISFLFPYLTLVAKTPDNHKSVFQQDLTIPVSINIHEGYSSLDSGRVFVSMRHNTDAVKVTVIVTDEQRQMKFLMQGLICYVDLKGKKNKNYGVVFPATARQQMESPVQTPSGEKNREIGIKPMVDNLGMQHATLKVGKEESLIPKNEAEISYTENGYLVYTFLLPYSSLGNKVGKKGEIGIGLVSEFERPKSPEGGAGGQGNNFGGGRPQGYSGNMGRGGSGRPPQGMGGGMGGRRPQGGGMRPGGGQSGEVPVSGIMKPFNEWMSFDVK